MDKLLTRKEAAHVFGVEEHTVTEWVKKGLIDHVRVGKRFWIPESAAKPKEAVK